MAATNINRVVLTGNLTRDPELRTTPSGTSVCSLRVACNTRRKDSSPASGSTSPTTSTSPSGARRARTAPQYLSKGRPVAVDGRLEWREWEDKDGNKRQAVDIIADSVQFLGSRDGGENGGGALHASERRPGRHRRTSSRRRPARRSSDDDIPF